MTSYYISRAARDDEAELEAVRDQIAALRAYCQRSAKRLNDPQVIDSVSGFLDALDDASADHIAPALSLLTDDVAAEENGTARVYLSPLAAE